MGREPPIASEAIRWVGHAPSRALGALDAPEPSALGGLALRPSFWLRAPGDDEPVAGQLGGVPVLPDDLAWPRWDRYGPLTFIAEIACGQLPSDPLALPRTGTLSFFVQDELPTAGGGEPCRGTRGLHAGRRAGHRTRPPGGYRSV